MHISVYYFVFMTDAPRHAAVMLFQLELISPILYVILPEKPILMASYLAFDVATSYFHQKYGLLWGTMKGTVTTLFNDFSTMTMDS